MKISPIPLEFPKPYHILLVENDTESAKVILEGLAAYDLHIVHVENAEEVFTSLNTGKFETIIIGVGITGDIDGIECCAKLRRQGFVGGILLLPRRGDEITRVLSIPSGADAYLAKPFEREEFLSLLQALIKKREEEKNHLTEEIKCGKCTLDTRLQKLVIKNKKWFLSPKEFLLIQFFFENEGKKVSRKEILDAVWGQEQKNISPNTLDVYLGKIRKKLGKDAIHTFRGEGYVFEV